MIYAVLSNFDFVAKFTVRNMNKDFIKAVRGGGGPRFMKVFHKIPVFFEGNSHEHPLQARLEAFQPKHINYCCELQRELKTTSTYDLIVGLFICVILQYILLKYCLIYTYP